MWKAKVHLSLAVAIPEKPEKREKG